MSSKRTALYENHKQLGAKFTEFGGWEMPVLYSGIVREHEAVRKAAGLFDTSHMGQIFVEGPAALDFLQKICTNDVSKCGPDQALYSHLCNEKGGVIDDIFIYSLRPERYLVIVNAATIEKDYGWMLKHLIPGVKIDNQSAHLSMLALQGPKAEAVAAKIFTGLPSRHRIREDRFEGETVYLCRTGYTGEDGFEVILPNAKAPALWTKILEAGKESGILPCGLGARDTLRLEVGYPLYAQDMDDDHTPLEAGLSWVVKLGKPDFIGKKVLAEQKAAGPKIKLTAFKLTERGIPRHGSKIFLDGRETGVVTSGTFSPSLQTGIALGYIPVGAGGTFTIECHGKPVPANLAPLPFYTQGSK